MRIIEGWRRRRKEEAGEGGRGEERMKFGILGYKIHTRHPRADMEKAGEYMYQSPRKRYSHIDYVRSDDRVECQGQNAGHFNRWIRSLI